MRISVYIPYDEEFDLDSYKSAVGMALDNGGVEDFEITDSIIREKE